MPFFISNKIKLNSESAADRLKTARLEKKIKIEDVAKKLNIKILYLQYLENGDYNKLPKGVYRKNFLREYALFLGLDYSELSLIFNEENNLSWQNKSKELFAKQVVKFWHFLAVPKIIKSLIIFLVALICFFYLGFLIKKIISPPNLEIYYPKDNFITSNHSLQIMGKSEKEAQIIINGELVLADKESVFYKEVNLKEGINAITITASKKYGRSKTIIKQILVKE